MKFKPWKDFKDQRVIDIQVDGPPCANCKNWKPNINYISVPEIGAAFGGVTLCHAESMHKDFSCYKPKDKEQVG